VYVAGLRGGHCSSFAIALSLGVVGALLYLAIIVCMVRCCTSQSLCAWPGSSYAVIALAGLLVLGFPAGYSFVVARTAIRLTVFL